MLPQMLPMTSNMSSVCIICSLMVTNTAFKNVLGFVKETGEKKQEKADLKWYSNNEKAIPLQCICQSYDNASNISGTFKGVQHLLKQHTKPDTYSPCANPSLNLTATDKVKSTVEFITFYGNVQSLWMPFSSSHKCWEILEHYIRCSLHLMSRRIIW